MAGSGPGPQNSCPPHPPTEHGLWAPLPSCPPWGTLGSQGHLVRPHVLTVRNTQPVGRLPSSAPGHAAAVASAVGSSEALEGRSGARPLSHCAHRPHSRLSRRLCVGARVSSRGGSVGQGATSPGAEVTSVGQLGLCWTALPSPQGPQGERAGGTWSTAPHSSHWGPEASVSSQGGARASHSCASGGRRLLPTCQDL